MPKTDSDVTISSDIQIPERRGVQYAIYPFADLKVGDSFAFPPDATRSHITGAMRHARTSNPDRKFSTRNMTENGEKVTRVWRTK